MIKKRFVCIHACKSDKKCLEKKIIHSGFKLKIRSSTFDVEQQSFACVHNRGKLLTNIVKLSLSVMSEVRYKLPNIMIK